MMKINNPDFFQFLCLQEKKLILCGDIDEINRLMPIFKNCGLIVCEKRYRINEIYDLLYENICERLILVLTRGRQNISLWNSQLTALGFVEYRDFIMYKNNGNVGDWDYIDVNLGYTFNYETVGYKRYGDSTAKLRIMVLGGSTTCEYEQWGVKCWPRLLYEKFSEDITVFNGGISGYDSTQELLKVIRDINVLKPDIIISFSGLNDAIRDNKKNAFVNNHIEAVYGGFINNTEGYHLPLFYGFEKTTSNYDTWKKNMLYMNEIAKLNDAKFFAFLQPIILCSEYKLNYEEEYFVNYNMSKQVRSSCERFYEEVNDDSERSKCIVDMSHCFAGRSGLFRDIFHVYEQGNRIIANVIAECISGECNI